MLKKESRKLDQGIDKARRQKSQLDELQSELKRQEEIKNLVKELEQKGKLIADKIPAAATLLDCRRLRLRTGQCQITQRQQRLQIRLILQLL